MRFFHFNAWYIKLPLLILILFSSAFLSSCADVAKQFGYQPVKSPSVERCMKAHVLITDLSQDSYDNTYQLRNGQVCHGVNNDF